jgi:hypothetical protein
MQPRSGTAASGRRWRAALPGLGCVDREGVAVRVGEGERAPERAVEGRCHDRYASRGQPVVQGTFCEPVPGGKFRLLAGKVALETSPRVGYRDRCRYTQRPFPGKTKCVSCGQDAVRTLDPETDDVFQARRLLLRQRGSRAQGAARVADEHHRPRAHRPTERGAVGLDPRWSSYTGMIVRPSSGPHDPRDQPASRAPSRSMSRPPESRDDLKAQP